MNPILQTVIATVLHLKRTCPACKRDQVVGYSDRKNMVHCKFCGAEIPPKHDNDKTK